MFAFGSATAQQICATKAVGKDGKPLAGAAKTSFMKRCCEEGAVGSDGKKLSGAAKASFVKNRGGWLTASRVLAGARRPGAIVTDW
jgi:hypothetical protein